MDNETRADTSTGENLPRRAFVRGVAGKALYAAPAVLVIASRRADARGVSCLPFGSPCTVNEDCCSLNCQVTMGEGQCMM